MATKGDVSNLDTLLFGGEPMIPLVSGFSRYRRNGVIQSDVQGGSTRQRKKFFNNPHIASATFWLETPAQQDYIQLFFERNEGKYFICHLAADRPLIEPYVVQVVSDWENDYVSAKDGTLTVTLEIVSARDEALDEFLFPMYEAIGSDLYDVLICFKKIVLAMPEE